MSFVVPNYNYAHLLPQSVESLLGQTFGRLEVIVIDDASTDGSAAVVESYRADPRVRVIQHVKNIGHLRTYNEGLALARGEFIGLLSADDLCLRPDAVARQVAMFDADPEVGFVYSALTFVDDDNQILGTFGRWPIDSIRDGLDEFRRLVFGNYVPASGPLVRKACHERLGYYDQRLPHTGDWELWLRLSAWYKVGYIADPLYGYRQHAINMHHRVISPRVATDDQSLTVREAFRNLPPSAPDDVVALRRPALRQVALKAIDQERQWAHRRLGWFRAWQALRQFPELWFNREFLVAMAKLAVVTAIGQPRTSRLVAAVGRQPRWRPTL